MPNLHSSVSRSWATDSAGSVRSSRLLLWVGSRSRPCGETGFPLREGREMTTPTTQLEPAWLDVTKVAIGSFLARYREPTLTAYKLDLKTFLGWCQVNELEPLRVTRGQLELYLRYLEGRGYAPATTSRRFGTVA